LKGLLAEFHEPGVNGCAAVVAPEEGVDGLQFEVATGFDVPATNPPISRRVSLRERGQGLW
jgi:hypothetical protein